MQKSYRVLLSASSGWISFYTMSVSAPSILVGQEEVSPGIVIPGDVRKEKYLSDPRALTDAEVELIEEVKLNPDDVGDVISKGAQSIVRMYQDEKVIKMPLGALQNDWRTKIMKAIMGQNWSQAQYEFLTSRKFLGDTVVHADFLQGKTMDRFVGIQAFKTLERIEPTDMQQSPEFRSKIQRILQGNGKMYQERGFALDIAGWDIPRIFAGRPYMNNLWKDETGEPCIIDTGLLDYQKHAPQILFQKWNMSKFDLDFFGREKN